MTNCSVLESAKCHCQPTDAHSGSNRTDQRLLSIFHRLCRTHARTHGIKFLFFTSHWRENGGGGGGGGNQ